MSIKNLREDFEKWAWDNEYCLDTFTESGDYVETETIHAYAAWMACSGKQHSEPRTVTAHELIDEVRRNAKKYATEPHLEVMLANRFEEWVVTRLEGINVEAPTGLTKPKVSHALIEAPLAGRWHHGNGFLCCGTFRIAREDWEAGVCEAPGMRAEVFDWMCERLNVAATQDGGE